MTSIPEDLIETDDISNGSEAEIFDIEELFRRAESPDLSIWFYVLSGIWLCFTLVIGSLSNGAVILSFFRVQSVRHIFVFLYFLEYKLRTFRAVLQ